MYFRERIAYTMFNKHISLLFILTIISLKAFAAVFVVTSNANTGAGTLREALTLATANGSETTDYINFNFADLSEAGRTITILTRLPPLSSNLIIDGTTQPGPAIGNSNTKINLRGEGIYKANIPGYNSVDCFWGDNIHDIEIYGIYFSLFYAGTRLETTINLSKSTNITFGKANKGNAWGQIELDVYLSQCSNISFSANTFGLDPHTNKSVPKLFFPFNRNLSLRLCDNIMIGGDAPEDGNTFYSRSDGLDITGTHSSADPLGTTTWCYIKNNHFGDPNLIYDTAHGFGPSEITSFDEVEMIGNTFINGNGIGLTNINRSSVIKSNKWGDKLGFSGSLGLYKCNNVTIGGTGVNEGNIISYIEDTYSNGIVATYCGDVLIQRNSIYCTEGLVYASVNSLVQLPVISATSYINGVITGKSTPNATIEVYGDGECLRCEAKNYHGTVLADGAGNWTITVPPGIAFTASATLNTRTSLFLKIGLTSNNLKITNPSCGNFNGSITGLSVQNSTSAEWKDDNGNIVGTSIDIYGLKPGKYSLTIYMLGCSENSSIFTLKDATPQIGDINLRITNNSCGNNNGSIKGLTLKNANDLTIKSITWVNQLSQIVGNALDLQNVPAGVYTLKVVEINDCTSEYGPLTIINTSGPSLNQSQATIQPNNCGQSIGSIIGITATGNGTISYSWKNAQLQIVGNAANLLNQPAGIYTLEVNDGGSQCGPIYSTAITIPELNSVVIDESSVQLIDATCNNSNGGIKGIKVTRGLTYAWYNSSNVLVSTSANLTDMLPGNYYLIASSATCSKQSKTYAIVQTINLIALSGTPIIINDQCTQKAGSITGLNVTGGVPPFNYKWTDANNSIVATTANLTRVGAGTYTLTITDASPCGAFSVTYNLQNQDLILPQPSVTNVKLCSGGSATIAVNNVSSTYTYRLYDSNNSTIPLSEEKSGKFSVVIKNNRSYYISQYIGQCESIRAEIKVSVGLSSLDIPNTFTPNGDGINDIWKITGIENAPTALVQIFNRSGQNVFESKGYAQPFAGKWNNQTLPTGTYYYIINMGASCMIISGNLTIIR